jgi:protein-S-isoprenylcysteine O-methyltransferase Ste14
MAESADHPQVPLAPPYIFLGHLLSAVVLQWIVPLPMPWPVPLRILGAVLLLGGLLLAASAISEMRKAHTTPDLRQPATALVMSGPYRFSRNPIYLGLFLIYLSFTLLAGTLWGLLLSPFLLGTITRSIIHAEERYLGRTFKERYQDYTSRVRQWI